MANYGAILKQIECGNPPEIEAKQQQSHERLQAKLKETRRRRDGT